MSFPIGPFRRLPLGGGAKISPYLPLMFPHLELYLDSRLGTGAVGDGGSLSLWADQSGHSPVRDAISAGGLFTDPLLWKTTAARLTPKGQPTVQWGVTTAFPGNALGSQSFAWPSPTTRGYTYYHYGRYFNKAAPPYPFQNQTIFNRASSTLNVGAIMNTGAATGRYGFQDNAGGGNPHGFGTTASIANAWKLHTIVLPLPDNNTVPMKYYLNGVQATQVIGPANYLSTLTGNDSYSLGNQISSGNTVADGDMGFFVWFSDVHSQATINLFTLWAHIFFGLT